MRKEITRKRSAFSPGSSALEMTPEDRELVEFRLASAVALLGDPGEAAALARRFLTEHGDSERAAEIYHLLAQSLQKLGRNEDAAQETLKLLKEEKPREKQGTGNLAAVENENGQRAGQRALRKRRCDERADYLSAARGARPKPEWRWPIVYQIGLCFERLRLTQRALEAYAFFVGGDIPKSAATGTFAADLPALKEMAQWKMDYLRWATDVDHSLSKVLKPDWKTAGLQPLKFRDTSVSNAETTARNLKKDSRAEAPDEGSWHASQDRGGMLAMRQVDSYP